MPGSQKKKKKKKKNTIGVVTKGSTKPGIETTKFCVPFSGKDQTHKACFPMHLQLGIGTRGDKSCAAFQTLLAVFQLK